MAWQALGKHFKGGQTTSRQSYLDGHLPRPASIFAIYKRMGKPKKFLNFVLNHSVSTWYYIKTAIDIVKVHCCALD